MKNASLTNIVMINRKIKNELDKMDNSIDLLAKRSKEIDEIIQEEEKEREEIKKQTEESKDKGTLPTFVNLEGFVEELKKVWNFNQKINEKFVNLKGELNKFDQLNQLFDKMEDIQTMVYIFKTFFISF